MSFSHQHNTDFRSSWNCSRLIYKYSSSTVHEQFIEPKQKCMNKNCLGTGHLMFKGLFTNCSVRNVHELKDYFFAGD